MDRLKIIHMSKIFNKSFVLLSTAVLAISSFFVGTPQVSAEIPGERFSADLGAADLSAVASKWPYLLLIGAIIVILLCLVNVFYRIKEKK